MKKMFYLLTIVFALVFTGCEKEQKVEQYVMTDVEQQELVNAFYDSYSVDFVQQHYGEDIPFEFNGNLYTINVKAPAAHQAGVLFAGGPCGYAPRPGPDCYCEIYSICGFFGNLFICQEFAGWVCKNPVGDQ